MASVSNSFTAVGNGTQFFVKAGDSVDYSLSGTFSATVVLERTQSAGASWEQVGSSLTAAASGRLSPLGNDFSYRFRCTAYTSGTAVAALSDVALTLHEIKDQRGDVCFRVTEAGVEVPGTMSVTGTSTFTGASSFTGASTLATAPITTSGVGAKNGATVTAVEYGTGDIIHKTVLTLASTPVSVVSVTTGNGVGGTKIYDFPEGYLRIHGCVAALSLAVETQGDFTDATPEGDVGIGTVAPANADALGTDATDDDYATAAAFTMDAYAATVNCPPEPSLNMDGTATAKDMYVNVLVDAADIDDDATTNVLVSGTVTVYWSNLGDY